MRRTAMILAGLVTAGSCTLTLAGSANAAQGILIINDQTYTNPSGCYDSQRSPISIDNQANQPAFIHLQHGCVDRPVAVVPAGGHFVTQRGASISIH